MFIREAGEADLPAILEITNAAIAGTTANWNMHPVDLPSRFAWLAQRRAAGLPVLVAVDGGLKAPGPVLGYASYGPFRPFDGYRLTVEHGVYVSEAAQGRGLGTRLVNALVARAAADGMHMMVAAISADNEGSIRLHERLGFVQTGRMPRVGRKFGRWLDLVMMQRELQPALLRPATAEDAGMVAELVRIAFAAQEQPTDPPPSALAETAESVGALLAEGGGAVALQDGMPVGAVLWRVKGDALYLGRLAVHPDRRGAGIGRALVQEAEAEARRRGLARLTLGVRIPLAGNRRLFAACGFTEVGLKTHDGYAAPTSVDMEKRLI